MFALRQKIEKIQNIDKCSQSDFLKAKNSENTEQ